MTNGTRIPTPVGSVRVEVMELEPEFEWMWRILVGEMVVARSKTRSSEEDCRNEIERVRQAIESSEHGPNITTISLA